MGVKGRLKDISLLDILQILHAEKKTVCIHIGSEWGYGKVYLKDGEIVHASYREITGSQAFDDIFSWKEGDFDVGHGETPLVETISAEFASLIKEGVKKADEKSGAKAVARGYAGDSESANLIDKLLELEILEKVEQQ